MSLMILQGAGAGAGAVVSGPARPMAVPMPDSVERLIGVGEVGPELERFDAAVQTTDAQMRRIGEEAPGSGLSQDLVEVHRLILGSPELTESAREAIGQQRLGAEWAVRLVLDELRRRFAGIADERLRARFEDVEAVADRLLQVLVHGQLPTLDGRFQGTVAVGLEISALEALELHRLGVAAVATEHGGATSHAAIVARTLGLPYVFGVHGLIAAVTPGEILWVDDARGEVHVRPGAGEQQQLLERRRAYALRDAELAAQAHAPCATIDGAKVTVGANVESPEEVRAAMEAGADEIGLVRTELLYLTSRTLPSEEQQYADAAAFLRGSRGRPVTFRTLDVAADKLPAGIHLDPTANPALGLRGIRFSLRRTDVLRTQLRAFHRAASLGPLRILLPMITVAEEVLQVRALREVVCRELAAEGLEHDARVPIGAMIETPSAAITADHVAEVCDFLSIGTNDLVQYAFAVDRQSEEVAYLHQPLHPAMLRILDLVFTAAKRAGRPVSICGAMAADTACTSVLVGLGLRSFSVPGSSVARVKAAIRRTEVRAGEQLLREAVTLRTQAEVMRRVTDGERA